MGASRVGAEIIEELILKAVKDADEKVFAIDRLAGAVVNSDEHRGLVGGCGRRAYLDVGGVNSFSWNSTWRLKRRKNMEHSPAILGSII
jgi:hypothetical protein